MGVFVLVANIVEHKSTIYPFRIARFSKNQGFSVLVCRGFLSWQSKDKTPFFSIG